MTTRGQEASQMHVQMHTACPDLAVPARATREAALSLSRAGWSQIFFRTVNAAKADPVLFRAALTAVDSRNACTVPDHNTVRCCLRAYQTRW